MYLQKCYESLTPRRLNVLNTGTKLIVKSVFFFLIGYNRFTRHCGKIYSCHFFLLSWIAALEHLFDPLFRVQQQQCPWTLPLALRRPKTYKYDHSGLIFCPLNGVAPSMAFNFMPSTKWFKCSVYLIHKIARHSVFLA